MGERFGTMRNLWKLILRHLWTIGAVLMLVGGLWGLLTLSRDEGAQTVLPMLLVQIGLLLLFVSWLRRHFARKSQKWPPWAGLRSEKWAVAMWVGKKTWVGGTQRLEERTEWHHFAVQCDDAFEIWSDGEPVLRADKAGVLEIGSNDLRLGTVIDGPVLMDGRTWTRDELRQLWMRRRYDRDAASEQNEAP